MNSTDAKKTVLVALVATVILAAVKTAQRGERPHARLFIGATVAGVILTALAEPAPEIAAGLAGITLLSTALASPETVTDLGKSFVTPRTTGRTLRKAPSVSAAASGASRDWRTNPPNLVPIGQGTHRLEPATAAAFRNAETAYGQTIYVTDSYRSFDQQAAGYRQDPKRFGPPETSAHVRGEAIDVDTRRHNLTDGRLVNALTAAGFCQANPTAEPWHFSYNGCR